MLLLTPGGALSVLGEQIPVPPSPASVSRILLGGTSHTSGGYLYAAVEHTIAPNINQTNIYLKREGQEGWDFQGVVPTRGFTANSFEVFAGDPDRLFFAGVNAYRRRPQTGCR